MATKPAEVIPSIDGHASGLIMLSGSKLHHIHKTHKKHTHWSHTNNNNNNNNNMKFI